MSSLPPADRDVKVPPRAVKPRNLALGIERIGFFALSHRTLCAIVFVILSAIAAVGFVRVKVDDSLSQLFRSDTDEFRTYEEVTRRFPSNEFDVLIVIEGDRLLERASLEKLRELAIELQLVDGTRGLISIFSAREPPDQGPIPPPLFPNPLPQGADYQALIKRVTSNEIIRGKMLSDDGKLTLMVLALEPSSTAPDKLGPTIAAVRQEIKTDLEGTGLKAELSGVPVMQLEIRDAIQRDRLVYNTLGFAVGCLIAIIFFRRLSFMIIAAAPPLLAILMALGVLGWLGFQPEHVPERDDAADHGHQFLRQHADHLCRARPPARGRRQVHGVPQRFADRGARLRAHPRDRRRLVHRTAIFVLRPHSNLRGSRPDCGRGRAGRGHHGRAAARRPAHPQRDAHSSRRSGTWTRRSTGCAGCAAGSRSAWWHGRASTPCSA